MKVPGKKLPKTSLHGPSPKDQRKEQILAAAFEVFADHGFEGARIDEVAKRAGIAKGTLYLYFRDKEQLFRSVVRTLPQKRFDVIARTSSGSAEELLRDLVSRMYTQIIRNEKVRSIVRLLIAESARFPQLAEIYHREIIAPGMNAMRHVLRHGIETGEFWESAAMEFPQLLAAPGVLAIVWRVLHGDHHHLDLDAYMKAHLNFILAGLRKQPV